MTTRHAAWHVPGRIIGYTSRGPVFEQAGGDGSQDKFVLSSLEDLRGRTPDELTQIADAMEAHLRTMHQGENGEIRELDKTEQLAFEVGMQIRNKALAMLEEHRAIAEQFAKRPPAVQRVYANLSRGLDDGTGSVVRKTVSEARDGALRALDGRDVPLDGDQKTNLDKLIRRNTDVARRLLVTETPEYRAAFQKLVSSPHGTALLDDDERKALRAFEEYRAMSEGTTTAGGFGIPVFIDPSIIMTAQGSGNPFLQIAKQVTINTNAWKGVSSAGVSWSFDTEASQVSDDSATLAQPSVTVFMARGFIPYSIEVGQDYPGFEAEMGGLLAEGYDELLVDKFTRGSGSGEPNGILTALSANTNVRVTVTTAGTIGSPDPYKVWKALPQRFRRNASWLMNVGVNNAIAQLGAANVYHAYTVGLSEQEVEKLRNRPVYESPYMPDVTTSTTNTDGMAVVGDFSNYVIARRAGMNLELVPQLFQQTTAGTGIGRPTGQRGWFAWARIGGGSANDLGFRLLVNS